MAVEDRSKLTAHPLSHSTPNAPLLPLRGLFSFRPSAPPAAADDHGGETPGTVDHRALIRARIRKQQSTLRDQLAEMTPASRNTALTITTAAATIPVSAGQQSLRMSSSSSSSMSEASPSESQVSICTTVSTTTTSPSSDSGLSGMNKMVPLLPTAFDLSSGFSLEDEKGKHGSASEHESERHHTNQDRYHSEVNRCGRIGTNEDSFSEASQPCSESTSGSIEGRPGGARQVLRKVSASVKKKLHRLWPEEDDEHAQPRWVHMPVHEADHDNPFYQVRYGVQFQNLVPQPPARFPYAHQIAYSSRYGSAVTTIDPSDRADLKEEERQRERQNRRALLRRRSTAGRFRRRPNITLPSTEGRITEPVEVARIRRAYGSTILSKTQQRIEDRNKDHNHDSLLEKINRQVRTGTQEWILTGVQQQQTQPFASTVINDLPGDMTRIAISDANQRIVSRRSLNSTVSTRAQGRPVRREDIHRSQSSFRTQWEAYQRQKMMTSRESSALESGPLGQIVECNTRFAQDLTARLEQVAATDPRAETRNEVPMPVLMITPCPGPVSETTTPPGRRSHSSSRLASQITGRTSAFLTAPRATSRGEGVERTSRRGSSLSPYASDLEIECDRISVRVRSSRSSMHSASSRVSAASSIANSIYSTLSEDWIRPPYYAKPTSARYPLSLQRSIRTLPPHIKIGVRRTSRVIADVKTVAEATRLAKQMRTRGLRDQDGSMIRPDVGDQLHTVEFTVVFKPLEGSKVAQDEEQTQPTLLFRDPCKSAFPLAADSMGFVEYGSDDEDSEFSEDGSGNGAAVDVGKGERRAVLDVNDTSAMVAMGINPLDTHPDPLAFYNTHFAHFQEYGRFQADIVCNEPPFSNAEMEDPWSARESHGGKQDLQENEPEEKGDGEEREHAKPMIGDVSVHPSSPDLPSRKASLRSRTLFKMAYARVRSLWSNGDLPAASTTALPLTMHRFQVCSRAEVVPENCLTMAAMPGQGYTLKADQEWIKRLPSGARALGQFDRDWLDAMPPLSKTT
ncbi:unnamed protein product [Mortierella alpina]